MKEIMYRLILILFFGTIAGELIGQPHFDIASISFRHIPGIENDSVTTVPECNFTNAFISVPLKNDSDYFIPSVGYDYNTINYIDTRFNLKMLRVSLSWVHRWNERWKTAFVPVSRFASAANGLFEKENFQIGGAVVMTRKISNRFKYSFGLYYNKEFFGPFFVPLAGVDWSATERLRIFGLLPNNFTVNYQLDSKINIGTTININTNSYKFSDGTFVRIEDNPLRLFLNYEFSKNNVISLEGGCTVLNKYRLGIRNDTTIYDESGVKDGMVVKVGYYYRVKLL
jgi:hypothetical protein